MNATSPRPSTVGLLVDDDELYLRALQRSLARNGIATHFAKDRATAVAVASAERLDFALVDLRLAEESGLDLIAPLRALRPDLRILLVTGYASVATAVEAIKRGADDYLLKPVTVGALLRALQADSTGEAALERTMTPLSRLEWEHIQQALVDAQGNVSAAARLLGMHRRTLQRKLAKRPGPERGDES